MQKDLSWCSLGLMSAEFECGISGSRWYFHGHGIDASKIRTERKRNARCLDQEICRLYVSYYSIGMIPNLAFYNKFDFSE